MRRLAFCVLLLVSCGDEPADAHCTVIDEGDGTATVRCPGGFEVRVPRGDHRTTCTISELPEGGRRLYCSDGTERIYDASGNEIFPGGGIVAGNAQLLGEQGRPGIVVRAGQNSTVTGENGRFELAAPAGVYSIVFEYPGYTAEVRPNTPLVGRLPWELDTVTLYRGYRASLEPDAVLRLSPTEDSLLIFEPGERDVSTLRWLDLNTREAGEPVSIDAFRPPERGAFRADGNAIVWVEQIDEGGDPPLPCGSHSTVVAGYRDGARRRLRGFDRAIFFGDRVVVFCDVAGSEEMALWDPESGALTTITRAKIQSDAVLAVVPGEALVFTRTEPDSAYMRWRVGDAEPVYFGTPSDVAARNLQVVAGTAVAVEQDGQLVAWQGQDVERARCNGSACLAQAMWIAPDGRSVAFTTAGLVGMVALWVQKLPENFTKVAADPYHSPPVFSADGALMVYAQGLQAGGHPGVFLLDLRGTSAIEISPSGLQRAEFTSRNELIYSDAEGHLLVLRPGETRSSYLVQERTGSWQLSSVARAVAYSLEGKTVLDLRRLDEPASERVWDFLDRSDPARPPFQLTDQGIVFLARTTGDDTAATSLQVLRLNTVDGSGNRLRDATPSVVGEAAGHPIPPAEGVYPGGRVFEVTTEQALLIYDFADLRLSSIDLSGAGARLRTRTHMVYRIEAAQPGGRHGLYVVELPVNPEPR